MSVFKGASPEERAAKEAAREEKRAAIAAENREKRAAMEAERARKQAEHARKQAEREYQAFLAKDPVGQARTAFERGDQVFQYSHDVANQDAVIVKMVGGTTRKSTADPSEILNAVCAEGWELVNGSFVFVEEGKESRDKLLSSGQNVATQGAIVGFYLFRRCDANRTGRVEH